MQPLALSQITTSPLTLEQDLQLCLRLGCALEIAEKKLSDDTGRARTTGADQGKWRTHYLNTATYIDHFSVCLGAPAEQPPAPA